jgi:penicillin-binding protein 2
MFHRRLLLVVLAMAIAFGVLAAQFARLTVAQGAEHRQRAESKLITREFFPTTRGRILDRKDRVLAQDRPSFDITVDFRVINGEWAVRQASLAARRIHGPAGWRQLARQERQAAIDQFIPIFQGHLDAAWRLLAETAGVEEARIAERREEIVRRVEAMHFSVVARRIRAELGARLAAGREISLEVEEDVRRRVDRPLTEQRAPHVVLSQVDDGVGFTLMRLADRRIDLEVFDENGHATTVTVPLMPELRVTTTGAREYPHESLQVEVDLSTLPGPMRRSERIAVIVEGVAYHIIGRMKERAQLEETQRRRARLNADPAFRERSLIPDHIVEAVGGLGFGARRIDLGEYVDSDAAGLAGVESAREDELRGLRGIAVENLESGERFKLDPQPGLDVRLTLDILLQARIQAIMSPSVGLAIAHEWHGKENPTLPVGTPLNGAAVVLDIDSGDILAMVSSPSIPRRLAADEPRTIFAEPMNTTVDMPWIERAAGRPYPPGSIVKALMVPAAVKMGRLDLDHTIDCTGHLLPNRENIYRCWIFKGHWNTTHNAVFSSGLSAPQALMVSCNIYFYTLGQRLGPDGMVRAYELFGLGEPLALGTGMEFTGALGAQSQAHPAGNRARLRIGDAILMGIGQGPVAWTPLHAADAYATLARGGIRLRPRLIDDGYSESEPEDLGLDPSAVAEALHGLYEAVNNPRGTGHHVDIEIDDTHHRFDHFNVSGVHVWGKTGTAEAPAITVREGDPLYPWAIDDFNLPEGVRLLRKGDHSWFVVMVGPSSEGRPRYVISVIMEYAGSGGRVSGPIVNQIIHALRAEGYL